MNQTEPWFNLFFFFNINNSWILLYNVSNLSQWITSLDKKLCSMSKHKTSYLNIWIPSQKNEFCESEDYEQLVWAGIKKIIPFKKRICSWSLWLGRRDWELSLWWSHIWTRGYTTSCMQFFQKNITSVLAHIFQFMPCSVIYWNHNFPLE